MAWGATFSDNWNTAKGHFGAWKAGIASTAPGNAMLRGIGETFGMHYEQVGRGYNKQWVNRGFLGRRGLAGEWRAAKTRIPQYAREALLSGQARNAATARAMGGARAGLGFAGRILGRALNPLFMTYGAYTGYQEGGVWGAAKNVGGQAATWGVMKAAGAVIGSSTMAIGTGIAAVGAAGYVLGEAARHHRKGLRRVEMGSGVDDQFGTVATIRQRSLAALNNTHINGRMALGNEAVIMHSSY